MCDNFFMHEIFEKSKLLQALADTNFAGDLYWLDCVDSTNVFASNLINEGAQTPFVVVARTQNAGKGRLSRKWYAEADATLCMSVAVDMPDDSQLIRSFTVRVANAVCSALEKALLTRLFIKWPNDIYSPEGKKIAGMLTELRISKTNKKSVILGIGINCFNPKNDVDESILGTMDSLENHTDKDFSMCEVCALVASAIVSASKEESISGVAEKFAHFDWLCGKQIQLDSGNELLSGVASGIDDTGELLLKLGSGAIRQIAGLEATILKR